jgi:ankyrin repeat protein
MLLAAAGAVADSRVVEAIERGDRDAAVRLVRSKADVNAPSADGMSALAWAAHKDDTELADLLLRAGANVNAANEYGVTPLALACANGSAAMVDRLLKAGANPNLAQKASGETPLMTAVRTGNVAVVRALLAAGADANARESRRGQSALMWAANRSHADVVMALLERGADAKAASKSGFTPLMFAARNGNADIARMLLASGAGINDVSPEDGTALIVAAAGGHEDFALFLLDKGADPNLADSYGFTALHFTAQKGTADLSAVEYTLSVRPPQNLHRLAKALLAKGANPNARITKDYASNTRSPYRHTAPMSLVDATPLFLAAGAGDVELMRMLLAAGAKADVKVKGDTTILMAAAGVGRVQDFLPGEEAEHLEAVKIALQNGAPVNDANAKGQTALMAAVSSGANLLVKHLVAAGADLNARDRIGMTPWTIAMAMSPLANYAGELRLHKETADLLVQLGAKTMTQAEFEASVEKERY